LKKRFFVLYILVGAFFVTAGVRLVFLQVKESRNSRNEVDKRLSLSENDPAPRGDICDRNGTVLAGNRKGYVVLVKKGENAHLALTVKNLAEQSGIEYKELLFMMQEQGFSKNTPYVLTEDATIELITKICESPESFPCAEIITRPVRDYIFPETAVHLLGRCGIISGEEYESLDGYGRNDYIGKQGAEKAFEDILRLVNHHTSNLVLAGYSICQELF
jgi:penicillin-binding protein 2